MTKKAEKGNKVMITERAAFARINRALAKQGQAIRRTRADSRWFQTMGRYFVVDLYKNAVIHKDCDLEELGREFGVLRDYETVEETE